MGGETICPPRRQQFDPEIAADLRPPATGPQSAHLWWPAVANGVVTCKIKKSFSGLKKLGKNCTTFFSRGYM